MAQGSAPPKRLLWQRSCPRSGLRIVPAAAANPFGSAFPWRPIPLAPFPARKGGSVSKGLRPFTSDGERTTQKTPLAKELSAKRTEDCSRRSGKPVRQRIPMAAYPPYPCPQFAMVALRCRRSGFLALPCHRPSKELPARETRRKPPPAGGVRLGSAPGAGKGRDREWGLRPFTADGARTAQKAPSKRKLPPQSG